MRFISKGDTVAVIYELHAFFGTDLAVNATTDVKDTSIAKVKECYRYFNSCLGLPIMLLKMHV